MNCTCAQTKCISRQPRDFFPRREKLVGIESDDTTAIESIICLSDREMIIIDEEQQLKKCILNETMTHMSCSYKRQITYEDSFGVVNLLEKIDSETFLHYQEMGSEFVICCALTGQKQFAIVIDYDKRILQIKHLDGFLVILYNHTPFASSDIDIFSLEEKKFVIEEIKETRMISRNRRVVTDFLKLETLNKEYFVTSCVDDHDGELYLKLWKIYSDNNKYYCKTTSKIKTRYPQEPSSDLIASNKNSVILLFGQSIVLYKVINSKLVLFKKINKIFYSSQLRTQSLIPINEFNIILVQELNQRQPCKEQIFVTFHSFPNTKSYQILDHDTLKCNANYFRSWENVSIFLSRYATLLMFLNGQLFKLKLDDKELAYMYSDIRKYARVLAQALRTKTSLFCTLPIEILIDIICKTRSSYHNDYSIMKTVALKHFGKP